MLSNDPAQMYEEIDNAEQFRDKHLHMLDHMVQAYASDAYRDDWGTDWSENHMYEFIRLTSARVIFDNPRVSVKSRKAGPGKFVAAAIRHGLNRWCRDVNLRRVLKRIYVSQCFSYGVSMVTLGRRSDMDPRSPSNDAYPGVYDLDPRRFFFDPFCAHYGSGRFAGHKWVRDKEDLLNEAESDPSSGWDVDAIKETTTSSDEGAIPERKDRIRGSTNRREIVGYEVWVPEHNPEMGSAQGFHGTIYTLALNQSSSEGSARFIRAPRPYYGPRRGPYTLYGVYPVPNDPYPLSPFVATYRQQKELNDIVMAVNKAVREYKRVVLVSADNPDMANKFRDAPDMFVIPVRGFQKDQIQEVASGGIEKQHVEQLAQAMQRVDRNTGMSQVHRGNVTSGATATEIAVADTSADESIAYIKQEFGDATVQLLENAAWFLYHDDRVEMPLGTEAAEELGMIEPWFVGGGFDDATGLSFDDIELEIEPFSMARMNEALARAQYVEMMNLALQAAAVIPTTPFYDWKALFDRGGDVMNDPRFSDFYLPDIAQQQQAMLIQQQQEASMMEQENQEMSREEHDANMAETQGGGSPKKSKSKTVSKSGRQNETKSRAQQMGEIRRKAMQRK